MLLLQTLIALISVTGSFQAVIIKAVKYDFDGVPPNLTGPLEQNYALSEAERYKVNQLKGPESFVYHRGHIYTGLADGRIVDISDCGMRTITRMAAPGCAGEAQCGRPLGMRMDPMGRLIVADSAKGIIRVNIETGEKETLYASSTPVNGRACKFINDVAVARDGTILFTDSSAKWTRKEFLYVVLEGEATGRLLAYSHVSNRTFVVLNDLAFPNGLEFGPNDEYLLISETGRARISKLDLREGGTWRQLSTFAGNLPGLPDNIRASGRGTYWVAMSQARHSNMTSMVDEYADQPQMRQLVAMISSKERILEMSDKYGMVVELDGNGNIVRTLQDPTGKQVAAVSEAMERDGFLYLGSFDQPYVSRVPLTKTFHVERFLQKIKSTCYATTININKLRTLLRQLVALAELRRLLLNAKRREDQAKAALTTTTEPSTSTATDSTATTQNGTTATSTVTAVTAVTASSQGTTPTTATTGSTSTESTTAATTTGSTVDTGAEESGGGIETGGNPTTTTSASTSTAGVTASDAPSTSGLTEAATSTGASTSTDVTTDATTTGPTTPAAP